MTKKEQLEQLEQRNNELHPIDIFSYPKVLVYNELIPTAVFFAPEVLNINEF